MYRVLRAAGWSELRHGRGYEDDRYAILDVNILVVASGFCVVAADGEDGGLGDDGR